MKNNKKYLNFPVPILKDLHINRKKFFSDVFDVGVYLHSITLTGNEKKRYEDSLSFFEINQIYPSGAIKNAKKILSELASGYPLTGMETDMLFDFYKNEKSDFDITCLAAFLGIRSILGKKPYDKTNKALIHARMFGFNSVKHLPGELTPQQEKFKLRYHMDMVLKELEINWYLKILSNHNRGFYLSFELSYDEIALIIEKDKQKPKILQLNEMKRKAIEAAKRNPLTTQ